MFWVLSSIGRDPLRCVALAVVCFVALLLGWGLTFGFDATRPNKSEELAAADPGDTDTMTAREPGGREDRSDRDRS